MEKLKYKIHRLAKEVLGRCTDIMYVGQFSIPFLSLLNISVCLACVVILKILDVQQAELPSYLLNFKYSVR